MSQELIDFIEKLEQLVRSQGFTHAVIVMANDADARVVTGGNRSCPNKLVETITEAIVYAMDKHGELIKTQKIKRFDTKQDF